jgi:hypothetical protein
MQFIIKNLLRILNIKKFEVRYAFDEPRGDVYIKGVGHYFEFLMNCLYIRNVKKFSLSN